MFDPVAVGRAECDAWAAYYRHEWVTFLRAAVRMVRAGFGMSRGGTLRGAWHVLRANQLWAPLPRQRPGRRPRGDATLLRARGGRRLRRLRPARAA